MESPRPCLERLGQGSLLLGTVSTRLGFVTVFLDGVLAAFAFSALFAGFALLGFFDGLVTAFTGKRGARKSERGGNKGEGLDQRFHVSVYWVVFRPVAE